MHRFNSVDELISFRDNIIHEPDSGAPCLVVCAGTGGQASGSNDIIRVIKRYILEHDLHEKIRLRITGCLGFCEQDPFILVEPGLQLYSRLKMDDVPRIIDAVMAGKVVDDLLYRESEYQAPSRTRDDIAFFKKQTRTILGNNEKLDPIRLYSYIKRGGYGAIVKVLENPEPTWIIAEVKKSGLRGRGGAGFPTGKKWEMAHAARNGKGQKYVICNADEGDPGAYMDRSLLEGNPHQVVEGMFVAGVAIGATKGYIYVRSEYPLAIKHALIAIRQCRESGLLGENILGTGIDFDIDIVRGAGAFVCGEETALIRSVEGHMGEPRQRPPYPVEKGLWGRPTCINNVETLSNIPVIIREGAEEYAKIGVPGSTGTKIFSLVGRVRNTGLVEVPMGITIGEIVNDIGGGSSTGKRLKAVQTGGPSGGCIPASMFELTIDFDSLTKAGSIMGSGGMIVMDEGTCMVDIAKYYMGFLKDESCGKCYPCRKGTQRMYEILEDISNGVGTLEQLDLLEELAQVVKDTTMCGLGQTASNPVLSTLKYFRDEYIEHIVHKRCRAGVCKELVGAPCQNACPIGTEAWRYVAHIARGEYEEAYKVIRETNPFPSVCARVCDHKCEQNCRLGTTGVEPVAIRDLKRNVTDNVDPSVYVPVREKPWSKNMPKVAIIGSGPAGLSAAHKLSLKGYQVTVFESETEPGGMLLNCIPAYRLPRERLKKEIESVIDKNITLQCNQRLGDSITIDKLFDQGYKAIFLAIGAQKGMRLRLEDEDTGGCVPSIEFLKAFNIKGESWAKGKVGVIGGGNSAIDAARTALRQNGVEKVTVIYRRTEQEMPAFREEIEAAIEEGIEIYTLVTPTRILSHKDHIAGIECIKNRLGEFDSSGRRRPVPIDGTEFTIPLDTLIIAISEQPDTDSIAPGGLGELATTEWGGIVIDRETMECSVKGVFAGGDVVTGPNTVVDAIAAGKKAAIMIDRYLRGEELRKPATPSLPTQFVEPWQLTEEEMADMGRVEAPKIPPEERRKCLVEVEMALDKDQARREARRCLRCDLEFTNGKTAMQVFVTTEELVQQ
jgi:NADH-quinone oxidoreductase subunit F